MELSKAFDTINHRLHLDKRQAYQSSKDALRLMCSYFLKNCKQKVLVNNKASTTKNIITRVLKGSIDGPLIFNSFINDSASFIQYTLLGTYLDDYNLSITGSNIKDLKKYCWQALGQLLNGFF